MDKRKTNKTTGSKIFELGLTPFMVGPTTGPNNLKSMPNCLPFNYFNDEETNVLKQSYSENTHNHLQTAHCRT